MKIWSLKDICCVAIAKDLGDEKEYVDELDHEELVQEFENRYGGMVTTDVAEYFFWFTNIYKDNGKEGADFFYVYFCQYMMGKRKQSDTENMLDCLQHIPDHFMYILYDIDEEETWDMKEFLESVEKHIEIYEPFTHCKYMKAEIKRMVEEDCRRLDMLMETHPLNELREKKRLLEDFVNIL